MKRMMTEQEKIKQDILIFEEEIRIFEGKIADFERLIEDCQVQIKLLKTS